MEHYGEPIDLHLPRHAVTPRQVARAGDIWRLFQVAAVEASTRKGWPPHRFLDAKAAFIVAHMTVLHEREASYGENVWAWSWLRDFRRGMLTRREVVIHGQNGPLARATQQWVYVDQDIRPQRAPEQLMADFEVQPTEMPPAGLPDFERHDGDATETHFSFRVWHTWMDPIAHVNHPVYVDWCDEAVAQVVARAGLDPQDVVPVAERVRYRSPAKGDDEVTVKTSLLGHTPRGDTVLRHHIVGAEGVVFAEATTVRRMVDGSDLGALWAPSGR